MGQPCLEKPLQNEPSSASAFAIWHHQLNRSQFIKQIFLLISYAEKVLQFRNTFSYIQIFAAELSGLGITATNVSLVSLPTLC